jgi:2-polyprenyl-6-methoxyphenol hydroxylase-like FAD-dependent oxidoreductase
VFQWRKGHSGERNPIESVKRCYGPPRKVLSNRGSNCLQKRAAREPGLASAILVAPPRVVGQRLFQRLCARKTIVNRCGQLIGEQARVVVGADGQRSLIARACGAAEYQVRPPVSCNLTGCL